MKNIHILSTDKPSRLYYNNNDEELQFCEVFRKSTPLKENKNIYITSDEKIKNRDWYIGDNKVYRASVDHMPELYTYSCKKIILTTDQDLINDGVQAIDDEFLNWFVKNPSCESVEVKSLLSNNGNVFFGYKIIIPKEEHKQGSIVEAVKEVISNQLQQVEELRQETLEEAAERLYPVSPQKRKIWINGSKWQQERMYSEEDMNQYSDYVLMCSAEKTLKIPLPPKEWFKQFKNK